MQFFLPEHLTPLFYTAGYASLTDRQRLRYNQLQGLYFNEQIAFFETAIARNVLCALWRDPSLRRLSDTLRQFGEEEQRHTAMFRDLNRRIAPHWYTDRHFYFIRAPRVWATVLEAATKRPRLFPMFIWLMLLQEERSLYYSREILRHREALDPEFIAVHRAHLADEVDHVRWDEELLDELWNPAGHWRRQVNAGLFRWMVTEFFNAPKRAQLRVVEQFVPEHPELPRQLLALQRDKRFQESLYSRGIVPKTLARMDAWPEFRSFLAQLLGEES